MIVAALPGRWLRVVIAASEIQLATIGAVLFTVQGSSVFSRTLSTALSGHGRPQTGAVRAAHSSSVQIHTTGKVAPRSTHLDEQAGQPTAIKTQVATIARLLQNKP